MGVRPSQTFRFSNDGVDKHRAVVARSRVAQDRPSRTEGFHEALPQTTNQRMRFCSEGVSCMVSGVTFKDRFANALLIKQQRLSTCFECVVCCRAIQEKFYAFSFPPKIHKKTVKMNYTSVALIRAFVILRSESLAWGLWFGGFGRQSLILNMCCRILMQRLWIGGLWFSVFALACQIWDR